jgi:hypothetical protein
LDCSKCGEKDFRTNFRDKIREEMLRNKLCHDCNYWHNKVKIRNDPAVVRANGQHYHISAPQKDPLFCGHGGRAFTITFHDGRVVHTTNLWSQGAIPACYREELHDNATVKETT